MTSPDVDHRPSPTLVVAGMLARSGWAPEQLACAFGLPTAFAQAVHADALASGESDPGADARLARALVELIKHNRQTPGPAISPTRAPGRSEPARAGLGCRASRRSALWLSTAAALGCLIATLVWNFTVPHPETIGLVLLGIAMLCLTTATVQARALNIRARAPDRPSRLR